MENIQLSLKNEVKLLGPFLWRSNRNSALLELEEIHPVLQHMLSFSIRKFVCILMKTSWIKMDSFVTITLKSTLLEITDARISTVVFQSDFSLEMGVYWTECFQLPTSTIFCGRYFKVTFYFINASFLCRPAGRSF